MRLCPTSSHNLHPFPTRRSSDLDHPGKDFTFPARQGRVAFTQCLEFRGRLPGGVAALERSPKRVQHHIGFEWLRQELRRAGLDRKSTRLNSSHLGISYAVFCLKK